MKIDKPSPATAINRTLATRLRLSHEVEANQCFYNSLMVFASLDPEDEPAFYVEGWLIGADGNYPIEHAWLEVHGAVVDVTLDAQKPEDYIAVFRYDLDEVMRLVRGRGKTPFYIRSKKHRLQMIESFQQLPINHLDAIMTAHLGFALTGIKGIYIDDEAGHLLNLYAPLPDSWGMVVGPDLDDPNAPRLTF